MPPIWFLGFISFCAGFLVVNAIRGFRRGGLYIAGQRVSPAMFIACLVPFLIVMAIWAAIGLGFITDYAPK
jgi:hypothetical protein